MNEYQSAVLQFKRSWVANNYAALKSDGRVSNACAGLFESKGGITAMGEPGLDSLGALVCRSLAKALAKARHP